MSFLKWRHFSFFIAIILGSLLALSATNWINVYAGLELNMFAFVPLINQYSSNEEIEASTKYFLVQLLGSIFLLAGGVWLCAPALPPTPSKYLILLGLIIKAGVAPFHFWFPRVMAGLSWPICLLLSTWQKFFPLFFLFNNFIPSDPNPYLLLFSFGALVGAMGGLNQTSLRAILAYSSITHRGWMLSVALFRPLCALFYLFTYILNTILIVTTLHHSSPTSPQATTSFLSFPSTHKIFIILGLLSLAGLPPFIGFLPKWQVLELLTASAPWALPVLLLASITTLFFYLKISFLFSVSLSWDQVSLAHPGFFTVFLFLVVVNPALSLFFLV